MAADTENQNDTANEQADEEREEALPDGLNDGGKAALTAERDARKKAAKEAREAKAELETLRREKADADEAKRIADERAAEEQGEYKTLAEKRATDLQTVAGERDGLKAENDALRAMFKPDVDAVWAELPEEITELYDGDVENLRARKAFIASHKKLIDRLADKQEETKNKYRTSLTPNPNPNAKPNIESPLSAREIRGG